MGPSLLPFGLRPARRSSTPEPRASDRAPAAWRELKVNNALSRLVMAGRTRRARGHLLITQKSNYMCGRSYKLRLYMENGLGMKKLFKS